MCDQRGRTVCDTGTDLLPALRRSRDGPGEPRCGAGSAAVRCCSGIWNPSAGSSWPWWQSLQIVSGNSREVIVMPYKVWEWESALWHWQGTSAW